MKKVGILMAVFTLVSSFLLGFTATAKTIFKDVPSKHWAKEEIDYLSNKEIIKGYSNGNFGPDDTIKRIDAARMIVRALNLDTANRPDPGLKDIQKDYSGYDIVAVVVDEGIFQGNNGYFNPSQTLTRGQMAAVVNRSFQLTGSNVKVSFNDISTKHWAYKDIQTLVANKITNGYGDNTFKPGKPITRAEFSVFMSRVLQNTNVIDNKETENEAGETTEENTDTDNENTANFEVIGIY